MQLRLGKSIGAVQAFIYSERQKRYGRSSHKEETLRSSAVQDCSAKLSRIRFVDITRPMQFMVQPKQVY